MLLTVDDVGQVVASSVVDFLQSPKHQQLLDRLAALVNIEDASGTLQGPLSGHVCVITGTFSMMSRSELESFWRLRGLKS